MTCEAAGFHCSLEHRHACQPVHIRTPSTLVRKELSTRSIIRGSPEPHSPDRRCLAWAPTERKEICNGYRWSSVVQPGLDGGSWTGVPGGALVAFAPGLGRAFLEGAALHGAGAAGGQWFHDSGNLPRVKDQRRQERWRRRRVRKLEYQQKGVKTPEQNRIMVPQTSMPKEYSP
jgi:hypothetical protein